MRDICVDCCLNSTMGDGEFDSRSDGLWGLCPSCTEEKYWSTKPCTNPTCPNEVGVPTKRCGGCHLDRYCSVECQAAAYPDHVARCLKIQAKRAFAGKEVSLSAAALDFYIRAVELGSPEACVFIGNCYDKGNGVAVDKERAALFWRVGALRGDVVARHNIGCSEYGLGNHEIAIRHWKIAAEGGHQKSLDILKNIYNADGKEPGKEFISKEDMNSTYRACHEAQMEIKTEEREKHRTGTSS